MLIICVGFCFYYLSGIQIFPCLSFIFHICFVYLSLISGVYLVYLGTMMLKLLLLYPLKHYVVFRH